MVRGYPGPRESHSSPSRLRPAGRTLALGERDRPPNPKSGTVRDRPDKSDARGQLWRRMGCVLPGVQEGRHTRSVHCLREEERAATQLAETAAAGAAGASPLLRRPSQPACCAHQHRGAVVCGHTVKSSSMSSAPSRPLTGPGRSSPAKRDGPLSRARWAAGWLPRSRAAALLRRCCDAVVTLL